MDKCADARGTTHMELPRLPTNNPVQVLTGIGRRQGGWPLFQPSALQRDCPVLTRPRPCRVLPCAMALAAPVSECRKGQPWGFRDTRDYLLGDCRDVRFGADTFLNIAQEKADIPFVTKATFLPTQTGPHANRATYSHLQKGPGWVQSQEKEGGIQRPAAS